MVLRDTHTVASPLEWNVRHQTRLVARGLGVACICVKVAWVGIESERIAADHAPSPHHFHVVVVLARCIGHIVPAMAMSTRTRAVWVDCSWLNTAPQVR